MEDQTHPHVLVKQRLDEVFNLYQKIAEGSAEFEGQLGETMADIGKLEHMLYGVSKTIEDEEEALKALETKREQYRSELEALNQEEVGAMAQLQSFLTQIEQIKSMTLRANSTIRSLTNNVAEFTEAEDVKD